MKASFDREALLSAVQVAATVAPKRSAKPVLANVLLAASDDSAAVYATDTELSYWTDVPARVDEVDTVLLPADRLLAILRESMSVGVSIAAESSIATITSGGRYRLPTAAVAEFPAASHPPAPIADCVAESLVAALKQTVFACDTDSSRYALGGVLLELAGRELHIVGTDGRRLAVATIPCQPVEDAGLYCLVPKAGVDLICRAIAAREVAYIAATTSSVYVSAGPVVVAARLIEGRFPKWRDVVPSVADYARVCTSAGSLLSLLRQAAVVCNSESSAVTLTLDAESGTLEAAASVADSGESQTGLSVSVSGGQSCSVCVNWRYLAEPLATLKPDADVQMHMRDGAAVVLESGRMQYVLMPLEDV